MRAAGWLLAGPPLAWAAYTWGSYLPFGPAVWRGPARGLDVALTFDDGPDPEHTPTVLDVLAREGIGATFFLIGARAARRPDLVREIAAAGHDLGNHTWSHRSLWLAGPRATALEVRRGHAAIADAAGRPPRFFRAPWGLTNRALPRVLRALGTPCVFWSVQPEGRRAVPAPLQVARVLERAHPGAIVDLHDADGVPGAGRRLVEALPVLIRRLRGRGYRMVPLRNLL
ncbi:MAG: polysaccharide deacetylase family protein [Candidatus Rokubacteria bacterium]|nr:polysaccharide deacetylase family protein [Candidatus Rokubacteria bacterium]